MSGMERFEQWARRARADRAPQPDVTGAVLREVALAETARARAARRLALGFSTAAACAALACALVGHAAWTTLDNPLRGWLSDLANWGTL